MGFFLSDNVKVFYSGHESHRKNGVAFLCTKEVADSVLGYNPVSDRIISLRLKGKAANTTLVQVYAPTADASNEEIDDFYGKLQTTVESVLTNDMLIVMGDWDAKISKGEETGIAGRWGLGERNECGERLINICAENELMVTNTLFQQPDRKLYTWTSHGGL